ncbi:MAG: major tail protein [Candidatus Izemoplasmatales bacterium]|nr:major tail protein [Candidatus Izemoplasmatales bacterium]
MSNKVTFGLTNVHYALATIGTDGSWSFGTPKRLAGAQEITTEIIGGSSQVYADDKVIATLVSNSGSTVTLKFTEIDDEFKKDIFGFKTDTNGNFVEVVNSETKTFALGYEIQGDAKSRRIWYYLCTATPSGDSSKSKADSIEANSISLNITARPIESGSNLILRVIASVGDTNYTNFLSTAPVLPTFI